MPELFQLGRPTHRCAGRGEEEQILFTKNKSRDVPMSSSYTLGTATPADEAGCRESLEVNSSLQSLRSLRAMRALRTMHAMQPGRVVCNDAMTSAIVSGLSSLVIRQSSFVAGCRCTG